MKTDRRSFLMTAGGFVFAAGASALEAQTGKLSRTPEVSIMPNGVEQLNASHYQPGQQSGHYESFFQRANHPSRPLAFWIRYTIFSPQGRPEDALGEVWTVYFDGETKQHVAVKAEVPFIKCTFKTDAFLVRVADARLAPGHLFGSVNSHGQSISWKLAFSGDTPPLFLAPMEFYDDRVPGAKTLTPFPLAVYNGVLRITGREILIRDWVGSQGHNWGAKHTDHYAWGQVSGFEKDPEALLECVTGRRRVGSEWSPFMTAVVLRHHGRDISLNSLAQAARAQASFSYNKWTFRSETDEVLIDGTIAARREAFVGLRYHNPSGGTKDCLNSMLASCELRVTYRQPRGADHTEVLSTKNHACFEILTDDHDHGIEIRA